MLEHLDYYRDRAIARLIRVKKAHVCIMCGETISKGAHAWRSKIGYECYQCGKEKYQF